MEAIFYIIKTLISILVVIVPLFLIVAYVTYSERKIIGFMQSRMGPMRVGPSGLLQPIADVLKLVSKEIIIPTNANKGIFLTAPMLMLIPSLLLHFIYLRLLTNVNIKKKKNTIPTKTPNSIKISKNIL